MKGKNKMKNLAWEKEGEYITFTFTKQEARIVRDVLDHYMSNIQERAIEDKNIHRLLVIVCNVWRNIKDALAYGE